MPVKAKVKSSKSTKKSFVKDEKPETIKSRKTCSAGVKPVKSSTTITTKAKAKAAPLKSSTFIKSTNKSAETNREKNHDSKHQSKQKGKNQTKIHPEVEMLVKMLTKKLKTHELTPASDDDNQCSEDATETNESSQSDEGSSCDSSDDSDNSSDDCSCSNCNTDNDDSNSTDDSDDDTSSSTSNGDSSSTESSSSSSISSDSSTSSSTSSSSEDSDDSNDCSLCESTDDPSCVDITNEFSDGSIVIAKLKRKPSKKYKASNKPKPSVIRKKTNSSSVKPTVKSKKNCNTQVKSAKTKPKKQQDSKLPTIKKEIKLQHNIKSEPPSISHASSVNLKKSAKNKNNSHNSNGMMSLTKPKIEPLTSPKPTRKSAANCCLPKANSTLRKSLKKSSENRVEVKTRHS